MGTLTIIYLAIILPTICLANHTAPPNYSYYVPKTMTIPTYVFYMLRRNMPQPQCAMLTAAKLQTAYKWDPVTKDCEGFVIPQESYKEYDKTPINKIYVLKKGMNSITNYRLVSLGSSKDSLLRSYDDLGYYQMDPNNFRFSTNTLAVAKVTSLDLEGNTFNWNTRALAFCGGTQSGTTSSPNCYYLNTGVAAFDLGPWKGPFAMAQGRDQPNLVSVHRKIYILGGVIKDTAKDMIEVFDTDLEVVSPLGPILQNYFAMDNEGLPMKHPKLTQTIYPCTVGIDESNQIVVAGGYQGTTQWKTLSSLSSPRWYPTCSRITRYSHDYIVLLGGVNQLNANVLFPEFLDLTSKSTTWETSKVFNLNLPSTVGGRVMGSVLQQYNETGCDVMLINLTTGSIHTCTGQFEWYAYKPLVVKSMVKMDAQLFIL